MKYLLTVLIIVMIATACSAMPLIVKDTLLWDAPTTNTDGSPITDLKGYKVYYSQTSGVYSDIKSNDVGNVTTISIKTVIGQLKDLYYFVVTAYDLSGNESDFSNEVSNQFFLKKSSPTNAELK